MEPQLFAVAFNRKVPTVKGPVWVYAGVIHTHAPNAAQARTNVIAGELPYIINVISVGPVVGWKMTKPTDRMLEEEDRLIQLTGF